MRLLPAVLLASFVSCAALGQTYTISTFAGGGLPVNVSGTSPSRGNICATLTNTTSPTPASLTITSGNYQSIAAGLSSSTPLSVSVLNQYGSVMQEAEVIFTVNAGAAGESGTFSGGGTAYSFTNSIGVATAAALTVNAVPGPFSVTASAGSVSTTFYLNVGSLPPAFGSVDTPVNNSTGIAGAISVNGWALSPIGIQGAAIWRDPVSGEGSSLIYVGSTAIVPGSRPDVAAAHPGYPCNNCGWGAQVLTNELPDSSGQGIGNGTYTLHILVTDNSGQTTDIGTTTFTVGNAGNAVPFGTIDTPTDGQTVSGTIVNFGWALTPQPNIIPTNGSTIWVFIDNGRVGHPVYNQYRVDIATAFPGLQNSNGAVGYYYLDTTTLANGLHTIAWTVTDSAGNAQGIGSRYFNVQNASGTTSAAAIPPTYFGMHLAHEFLEGVSGYPWPTIQFGALRLLGDNVTWADVEPTQGIFDFTNLDALIAGANAHGITDLLNTLVKTPTWASSNPTATICADYANRLGGCYPPSDLNADGTGTDQYWKDYVTAIVQHVCTPGPCKISNWEVWNEPNSGTMWQGTLPQLVRLTQDAYQIIKGINLNLIVSGPTIADGGDPQSTAPSFLQTFLQDGGEQYIDVIGFHGYLLPSQVMADEAELVSTGIGNILSVRSSLGLPNKPLWDTEGSWGPTTNLEDPDLEASFVARYYLLQATLVQRFYWYAYDYPIGTLWDATTMTLLEPGVAYGQVYNWMVGAMPAGGCTSNGSIYTCGFTRPGGYQALAVWDSSLTCSNGSCTTAAYTVPSGYIQYRDLTGNVTAISPNTQIQLSIKPILLENQNP